MISESTVFAIQVWFLIDIFLQPWACPNLMMETSISESKGEKGYDV